MKTKLFLAALLFLFPALSHAALVTKTVEYQHKDATLEGYLAYDDSIQGKRPGVIVVHEWKGLNDYAKMRAEELAKLGYAALAIDMYSQGIRPQTHEEAAKVSGLYRADRQLMRDRAQAGLDFFKTQDILDPSKIAAIGYCFGGTTVLEMARAGMDVKGVASFHGGLDTPVPAKAGDIKAKVIAFHGAEDGFVKPEVVEGFKKEMETSKADWQLVEFGGAVHSFTVPSAGSDKSTGMAYNPEADKRSWKMLESFLKEVFAG